MTRKEIILETLDALTASIGPHEAANYTAGFSANELSERTGYDRSNVSRDLNALVDENRAIKLTGRPVRFLGRSALERHTVKGSDDSVDPERVKYLFAARPPTQCMPFQTLENLVGAEGSIKSAIGLAKMSVLYPRKLNILLMGETGVGKTTFAESVYAYAANHSLIDRDAAFVSFNCSEYADNPQLLFSHLFGHVKGAFTGANHDKTGLVEEAEGGILLLDEIHRLKSESQEMLFQLIDKGCYRKLGETGVATKANLMLIGATTERIDSYLLGTFKRRFPVVIHMPPLAERPITERFRMIVEAFYRESKELRLPLHVKRDAMLLLLLYSCAGNIGQLVSDIQLTCANCFRLHIDDDREMTIDSGILMPHIREGATADTYGRRDEAGMLMDSYSEIVFDDRQGIITLPVPEDDKVRYIVGETDMREFCVEAIKAFEGRRANIRAFDKDTSAKPEMEASVDSVFSPATRGAPSIPLEDVVLEDVIGKLRSLVKATLRDSLQEEDNVKTKTMELLRDATMFIDNEKVMREGEKAFGRIRIDLPARKLQSLRIRFLLHLACMLERVLQKLPLESPEIDVIPEGTHEHIAEIRQAMKDIETAFGVEIPDVEIRFLNALIYTV
ncbi:MAG: sigma 54-interacting transcriptional regulator [Clostridiales Family XIII bacterium]|jgi:transcriptional regulator with AAA-type ATPase domain|nr:sigma 54-interacting transcriptional regulator [Clostridiales Family XIII bacterium]